MISELFENGCIKEGNFKLKSGEISKYYFDMKNIISVFYWYWPIRKLNLLASIGIGR